MNHTEIAFSRDLETINTWLKARLAHELKVDPAAVDPARKFNTYGLDSIVLVNLSNDLADWMGKDIDPTIFWEYESIEELAPWIMDQ